MNTTKLAACIDIGSNRLRMVIGQSDKSGKIKIIEELRQDTGIGRDTFTFGRIRPETLRDVCSSLDNFSKKLAEYGIENCKAVATSGIREAENSLFVVDQIRAKTGFDVDIINNAEERFLTFKGIRYYIPQSENLMKKCVLVVNIGSGGLEISTFSEGRLKFTHYLKSGTLRLRELLADVENMTLNFPSIMEEYVDETLRGVKNEIRHLEIEECIALGSGIRSISSLCATQKSGERNETIQRDEVFRLYSEVFAKTTTQISKAYNLDYKDAEIMLPSIMIFKKMLEMTKAEAMNAPWVSLRHGLLVEIMDKSSGADSGSGFGEDVLSSVRYIADRFGVERRHSEYVERMAVSIFNQTKKLHRLKKEHRLYLQVAALLHDVGKAISHENHSLFSYDIIKAQNIIGFSNRETEIIANVAMSHGEEDYCTREWRIANLGFEDQVVVAKLAAILKIADSLDKSHLQKIDEIKIACKNDTVIFKVKSKRDTFLEKWMLAKKCGLFEEVMGTKVMIKTRGDSFEE
ncbi:Ppx/GppA phosphatase [Peptoclostridium acidaminophilum DSM 3953]|uniref:Ppx/GppA phosphatase n=1 Tax=Peptoclostridium acidaminophilum DSM 3953 TaxID=1286171 RepID=W8TFW3_PEPAC|nr:HD domain-containing protein [Peptoclostridium acidaminophilum]AHM56713.1 Ppx/GppA phosphatase [Peptoclostridium acidaminophilum DSM 3953]